MGLALGVRTITPRAAPSVAPSVAPAPGSPSPAPRRTRAAARLAAVPVALGLPSILAGPNLHADDFHYLELARDAGWWRAGGPRQLGRPGAYLVYDLLFGLIGGHPVVLRFALVILAATVTGLLYLVLRSFVGGRVAVIAALLWAAVPTHVALERWASCAHALVALALVLGAVLVARHAGRPRPVVVGLLLGGSILTYEIVAPAAIAIAVLLVYQGWLRRGSWLAVAAPLAFAGGWVLAVNSVYPESSRRGLRLPPVLVGNFGFGLPVIDGRGQLAAVLAVVAIAAGGWWVVRASHAGRDLRWPLAAGMVALALGVAPAFAVDPDMIGMQDRFTAVSGIGASLLLACTVEVARRRFGPVVGSIALAVLLLVATMGRVQLELEWHRSGVSTVDAVATLDAAAPTEGRFQWVAPVGADGRVAGIIDGWNATAALRWWRGDDSVTICIPIGQHESGPGCEGAPGPS